jgi:hypothetical protein
MGLVVVAVSNSSPTARATRIVSEDLREGAVHRSSRHGWGVRLPSNLTQTWESEIRANCRASQASASSGVIWGDSLIRGIVSR